MLKTLTRKLDPEPDAIDLLKEDHRKVEKLFSEFEGADDGRTKLRIARQICHELDVHAKIEEKLFYPESKEEVRDARDEVNEGIVEHEGIKRLVKQLSTMTTADEFFDSRMKVLQEYVKHHVKEEETSMFPKIAESDMDLQELGERLMRLKQRYQGDAPQGRSAPRAGASNGAAAHRSA